MLREESTLVLGRENIHEIIVNSLLNILWFKKKNDLKFYFCILRQAFFFFISSFFSNCKLNSYLNCSRPEMFDEFFMNGFHLLLFWSDVSYLWWLIKQWIITALAITCDKNMAWVQMTGIFFYYNDIIARLHKEKISDNIKKRILEKTWLNTAS